MMAIIHQEPSAPNGSRKLEPPEAFGERHGEQGDVGVETGRDG